MVKMSGQGGTPAAHEPPGPGGGGSFTVSVKWIGKPPGRTTGKPPPSGVSVIKESNVPKERVLNVPLIARLRCRTDTPWTGMVLLVTRRGGSPAGEPRISTRLRATGLEQLPHLTKLVVTVWHPAGLPPAVNVTLPVSIVTVFVQVHDATVAASAGVALTSKAMRAAGLARFLITLMLASSLEVHLRTLVSYPISRVRAT